MTEIHLLGNEYESAVAELRAEYKRMDFSIEAETRFFAALERVKDLYNQLEALKAEQKPDPVEPPIDPEDTPILPMRPVEDHYTHCPSCNSKSLEFSGVQSDPIDGLISNYVCKACGVGFGEPDDDEESRLEDGFLFNKDVRTEYFEDDYDGAFGGGGDPFGWMRHFRPDPAKVRADYKAGCLFVRKMTGSGWTKDDVIRFIHKFLFPSAAFIAGTESFFFKNYRHNVRYCNWYHWQSDDLREKWENHPRNYIPF